MTKFSFRLLIGVLLSGLLFSCNRKPDEAVLTIYNTTDVHGSIFDYDLKQNRNTHHSLAHVSQYLKTALQNGEENYILLDAGDILQGQPSNYYYNFIDTTVTNIAAQVMNYLKYDAAAVGNHDIEAGHPVYDKVKREFAFPWLAANIIDVETGQPYFQPYTLLHRNGLKIAVLGMTTPGIPKWLPHHLWSGLEFEDMIETAKIWIPKIRKEEKPDLLIGLFHSGFNYNYAGEDENTSHNENASMLVARQVDGLDIAVIGHDHQEKIEEITNDFGNKVLIIDARTQAYHLGKVRVHLKKGKNGYDKTYQAELIDMTQIQPDSAYVRHFQPQLDAIKNFIGTPIGNFTESLSGRDGLFGPSAFTDLIHNAQLSTTEADLSFSTVLQMNAFIPKGEITIRDMFNLYKFENGLYVMRFSGTEIDRYLEYAYGLQYNTMSSPQDHLLKFKTDKNGNLLRSKRGNYVLANDFFNYSCAAGIRYTVDVSRQPGERIEIQSMSDGKPFYSDSTYLVAINSYRGNGGGGHLTQGIGWNKDEIEKRIVKIYEKDVRYYITEYIKKEQTLTPHCRNDWKVIPEKWFESGKAKNYGMLYEGH